LNDHWHDVPLGRNSGSESIGRREFLTLMIAASLLARDGLAQEAEDTRARFRRMSEEAERRGLAEPFKGITTDGKVVEGPSRSSRPVFLPRPRARRRKNFSRR
jgi:hypothetical protein